MLVDVTLVYFCTSFFSLTYVIVKAVCGILLEILKDLKK